MSGFAWTSQDHSKSHSIEMHAHSHEGHIHEELVDGRKLEVDPDRFDNFIEGQTNSQVAGISVNGMGCDFCDRGIERTFKKDKSVQQTTGDWVGGRGYLW